MRFPLLRLTPIIFITAALPASAATLHVPADHPTIQSCIHAAVSGQDECVVAPGTYNELINFLGKAITLRSSHGPQVTTIDGTGLNGSVVTCVSDQSFEAALEGFAITGGVGTRPYERTLGGGVYVHGYPGYGTQIVLNLRDLVITGNEAYAGGGIYVDYRGTLRLWNCEVSGNTAAYGGGIFGNPDARIFVQNSSFHNNSAEHDGGAVFGERAIFDATVSEFIHNSAEMNGGAVAIVSAFSSMDEIKAARLPLEPAQRHPNYMSVKQCIFELNSAIGQSSNPSDITGGGAIFSEADSLEISGSTFTKNKGRTGGAILNRCCVGAGKVSDCSFLDNEAYEDGGGVYNCETVHSSLFLRNRAGAQGGGTFMCSVEDSIFRYNSAVHGGGMCHGSLGSSQFLGNHASQLGGGVYGDVPWARADNCLFVGNMAYSGGGAFFEGGVPFNNCTVASNLAHTTGGGGIGVLPSNSVFWGNDAGLFGDELGNGEESFSLVTATDVKNSGGSKNWDDTVGIDGGGNIDADPSFVRLPNDGGDGWGDDPNTPGIDESLNDDFGDLRLSPGSSCINAGNSDFVGRPYTDLDGHARVLCGRADMGAYEFGIGDFDCDQSITLTDFAAIESCSTETGTPYGPGCQALDFEFDADVDLRDFAAWQNVLGD